MDSNFTPDTSNANSGDVDQLVLGRGQWARNFPGPEGPWQVNADIELTRRAVRCVGITVTWVGPLPGKVGVITAVPEELTTTQLRQMPSPREMAREWADSEAARLAAPYQRGKYRRAARPRLSQLISRIREGEQRPSSRRYQKVADLYRNAPAGVSPTQAVADGLIVSPTYAGVLIFRARRAGYLGPAIAPGIAGELPEPSTLQEDHE